MQGKVKRSDSDMVYVGIDVAKNWLDVAIYPANVTFRFANTKKGHKQLLASLATYQVGLVVCEATGKHHRSCHAALHAAGIAVCVINPYRSRKFADILGKLAKTDTIDAMTLAQLAALHQPNATIPAPEKIQKLAELISARIAAVGDRTAVSNRHGAAQCANLKRELGRQLKAVDKHIARLEAMIRKIIASDEALMRRYDILVSIPGIADITAMGLIGLLSELGTCTDKEIAALVGVAPMNWDSGEMRGRRAIRGGRAAVRKLLYMPAMVAVGRGVNADLQTFYERLRANAKPAKVALVAVMRKLIILANTLIFENRKWAPKMP